MTNSPYLTRLAEDCVSSAVAFAFAEQNSTLPLEQLLFFSLEFSIDTAAERLAFDESMTPRPSVSVHGDVANVSPTASSDLE